MGASNSTNTTASTSPATVSTIHTIRNTWYAAKTGDLDTLRTLIESEGHRFDAPDAELNAPFYYACTCDHPLVLRYLHGLYVQHGVEMPLTQRKLCSVAALKDDVRAFVDGKKTIDDVISGREQAAREATMTIWDAAKEGNLNKLRQVLKYMPDQVTARDESGHTALFYACQFANPAAVAVLVAPFRKAAAADEATAEEVACRAAGAACNTVLQVLDGTITMKDIMMQEKAKAKAKAA
ncbi:hypothetical protein As57867_004522, partial [Aphanomyces stellatus]